ncbi:hypothetical protein BJB45_04190 [Halomonas huangheensis]|uniref:DUF3080 domain-containing protein n=1 Tax=Halomonas huangheensis TaxID=1178482 RepID=W1N600_9GAMM|nr:hypothetical protein AR456_05620 [Halomonas huangheensis]ERL50335.1 hypothetical protein BJB45_04190 [Halomonas huangheensis]
MLLLAGWLTACSDSESASELAGWQETLGKALNQPAPKPRQPGNIGDFPQPRALLQETADVREGMLNIYALRRCGIINLIAQRNNQLGRVAPPSQRWIYELTLWRQLDSCLTSDLSNDLAEEDLQRLQRLTALKTHELPIVSYNTLVGSEEWTGSFSRASSPLDPSDFSAVTIQLPALRYLLNAVTHQFDHQWQPDSAQLEQHLKQLRARPLSAQLMRTLMLATTRLDEGSALLSQALETTTDCSTQSSATLPVPPRWLDDLERQSLRWFTTMDELLDAHIAASTALQQYRRTWLSIEAPEAPLPHFQRAYQHHKRLLHTFHQRCN